MAEAASHHNPDIELALITDLPEQHSSFPGKLIEYRSSEINPWINKFVSKRREIEEIAGGYWLYTLERIFALRAILPVLEDQIFIHVESDVYMNISEYSAQQIARQLNALAVPRFSADRGIASIMIAPSRDCLITGLNDLQDLLLSDSSIDNDMTLLGLALNNQILAELPTNPTKPLLILGCNDQEIRVLFDGAALGQYLLGQDPFHTDGRRISGYINQETDFDASGFKYALRQSQQSPTESLYINENEILNIHVHSKMVLPPISSNAEIWIQAIGEANGTLQRKYGDYTEDTIHSQKISVVNRIRIAKRRGLFVSALNAISRRVHDLKDPK
jgi:hypothetical protein